MTNFIEKLVHRTQLREELSPGFWFRIKLNYRLWKRQNRISLKYLSFELKRYSTLYMASFVIILSFFSVTSYAYYSDHVTKSDTSLYAIKTKVEDIRGELQFSAYRQLKHQLTLMERRIQETKYALEKEGKIDVNTINEVKTHHDQAIYVAKAIVQSPDVAEEDKKLAKEAIVAVSAEQATGLKELEISIIEIKAEQNDIDSNDLKNNVEGEIVLSSPLNEEIHLEVESTDSPEFVILEEDKKERASKVAKEDPELLSVVNVVEEIGDSGNETLLNKKLSE